MKIAHIYAHNLQIFEDALEGTGCRINGSKNLDYLMQSLPNFNARDVMGLIVFRSHMTKKTLKLIKAFDDLFIFTPLPVIVICDDAYELYDAKKLRVKHSKLFLVNSVEGTISDIDVRKIFATLSCESGEMYDLSGIELSRGEKPVAVVSEEKENMGALAEEVLAACAQLGGTM